MIMNNKAKTSKVAVAGVVGLTAAGIAATIALANGPAADTPDSKAVERHLSVPVQQYTGPRTADAAEAWIESEAQYSGPRTADAAEAWLEHGNGRTGPTTVARLYQGCQVYSAGKLGTDPGCRRGDGPLRVHRR
jgi:hypothetical protein